MKNKLNNQRGFTLAELLIVVAIIAVLVAISIPIFSSKLEASRESTDAANLRSAYAAAANCLLLGKLDDGTDDTPATALDFTVDQDPVACYYTKTGKVVPQADDVVAMTGKSTMDKVQGSIDDLPEGVYLGVSTASTTAPTWDAHDITLDENGNSKKGQICILIDENAELPIQVFFYKATT